MSYPFLCSFYCRGCSAWSRDELRSHQLAGFGNQLGHPPTLLALCAPRAEPGSWERGQCWELCCSSHTSPIPRAPPGPSSSPSPALAPGRVVGAASVQGRRIPWEAEAQGPEWDQSSVGPVPLTSPTDPLVPRAGALVRHSSFLASVRAKPGLPEEEGRAFPAWKEVMTGAGLGVWRAQEAAEPQAHPEVWPLQAAISTSAGPGAVPWLGSPGSPQLLWDTAGLGGSALHPGHRATCAPRFSPSCGGTTDQAVLLTGTGQQCDGYSQHKHKVSLCLFWFFLAVSLDLHPGAAAG